MTVDDIFINFLESFSDIDNELVTKIKTKYITESKSGEYEVPHISGNSKLKTDIPPSDRSMKNLPRDSKRNAKVKFQDWLEMNPCELGLGKGSDGKWYGWSHRAVYGFGIGDKVKKGDCAYKGKEYTIKTEKQAKDTAIAFSDSVS